MDKEKETIKTFEYEEEFPTPQGEEVDVVEEVEEKKEETPDKEQKEEQIDERGLDLDWGEVFTFNRYI